MDSSPQCAGVAQGGAGSAGVLGVRRPFLPLATALIAALLAPSTASPAEAPGADFKVVTWYDRSDPIASFQYQVYDVRKGDYTPAVDAWVAMMREKFPGYEVAVRDVDLAREPGPSETRKVGAVVHRELLAAAASEGVVLGATSARDAVARQPLTVRIDPIAGIRGPFSYLPPTPTILFQNPTPAGFPVPMPFPRPHP